MCFKITLSNYILNIKLSCETLSFSFVSLLASGREINMSEEMKKEILNKDLSDEELKAVNGGYNIGGCQEDYYEETCDATVESGSWCWSNDCCEFWDSTYTRKGCWKHDTCGVLHEIK